MSLEALMRIVPPPNKPVEAGSGRNWLQVEQALGTALPSDYKEYINLYDTGELGGFVAVYNPFSEDENSQGRNLLVRALEVLDIWRSKRASYRANYGDQEYPYTLYP